MVDAVADPTLMNRQQALDVVVPEIATVCGVGGIGFWVAFELAMLGCQKIVLFDPDTLENSNRNRLPYAESDVGKNKAAAAREFLQNIRPDCMVIDIGDTVNEFNMAQLEGFIFMCTDTISSQRTIRQHCVDNNLPFIRLGYDGRNMTIENLRDMEGVWDAEDDAEDAGRYTVVPSYVITPQLAAITALLFSDMNLWRGFPRNTPEINISGTVFHIGQAILQGDIFSESLRYPDRHTGGPQMMSANGRRIRI